MSDFFQTFGRCAVCSRPVLNQTWIPLMFCSSNGTQSYTCRTRMRNARHAFDHLDTDLEEKTAVASTLAAILVLRASRQGERSLTLLASITEPYLDPAVHWLTQQLQTPMVLERIHAEQQRRPSVETDELIWQQMAAQWRDQVRERSQYALSCLRAGRFDQFEAAVRKIPEGVRQQVRADLLAGRIQDLDPSMFSSDVRRYRSYRRTVRSDSTPSIEERRRRGLCRRPDKMAFEDTDIGRAAAEQQQHELQASTPYVVSTYSCSCGWLHVGNTEVLVR